MTHFMRDGNRYTVAPPGALDITERLPLGTYKVNYNDMANIFYLEQVEDFVVNGKIYGDTLARRDRVLHTFHDRSNTTGVLLTGEKGSGKTLLAKLLSVQAREADIPTLVINMPWCGDTFNAFMQSISQPVVVIFDEFEKVYDSESQQKLLTLLDGTYSSKKLFILTANNRFRVDDHMKNRPGRIFYSLDFEGLSVDFIREYCQDNLDNKKLIDDVAKVSRLFGKFNFDLLKAIVEEMNRFDEGVEDALAMLNAEPEHGTRLAYVMKVIDADGQPVPADKLNQGDTDWFGNPMTMEVSAWWYVSNPGHKDADEDGDVQMQYLLGVRNLIRVNLETGDFLYEAEDGTRLTLSEKPPATAMNHQIVY